MTGAVSVNSMPTGLKRHIHGRTLGLLRAWFEWREAGVFPKVKSWPEVYYRRVRTGKTETVIPVLCTIRSTAVRKLNEDVQEMGWAFLGLEKWKQYVIWQYFVMRREEWETFRKSWKISKGKLRSILLDLQDEACRRGLVAVEEEVRRRSWKENAA